MPTTVVKTIGTASRDYSTLQAWEDACPANLVSDDKIWKGECYNDSEFTLGLYVSGITTDSTRYVWLTAASGQSFIDHANVRTNALIYDQSKGVGIVANPFAKSVIDNTASYTRVDRLQAKRTTQSYSSCALTLGGSGSSAKDSLFQKTFSGTPSVVDVSYNKIYNCAVIDTGGSSGGAIKLFTTGTGKNCTVVNASGSINGTGVTADYSGALLQNMAVFGFTTGFSLSGADGASGYNGTDAASAPGSNNQTSLTYSDQFQSTTADFRLKSGATLINTGNTDATNAPNDITGLVRGVGTAGDIGAWEFAASGITITCTPGNATTEGITSGISSATTISCNTGTATTAGVLAVVSSATTITCNVGGATTAGVTTTFPQSISCNAGNATTAGVTAGIAGATTISCNVGNVSVAGITAGISSATTISCNAGTATTSGIAASFPQTLSCDIGNATTAGITAQVDIAGQIVIGCNAGTATTAGASANISSAFVLACNPSNATTLGATAYFPQSLQCSPGNAITLGVNATFTVAGPTTIVCNAGNAYAAGVHCNFGSRFDTPPDAIVTVTNKRNRVSVISRRS